MSLLGYIYIKHRAKEPERNKTEKNVIQINIHYKSKNTHNIHIFLQYEYQQISLRKLEKREK